MGRLIVLAVLAALLACGCASSSEKVSVVGASLAFKERGSQFLTSGSVIGSNDGDATYKMCVAEMRGGEGGKLVYGTAERTTSIEPGERLTINVDDKLVARATHVDVCCYKSEGYAGSPTCSEIYALPAAGP
jgi:hypothetical protein